jgi:hypothetical protein
MDVSEIKIKTMQFHNKNPSSTIERGINFLRQI